jgi:hypothetical protein
MSKKRATVSKIVNLVAETKKERGGDWPVGDVPDLPTDIRGRGGKRPGDWPLGVALPTKPELEHFSSKLTQCFGVKLKLNLKTKINELAATIDSLVDRDKV